MALDNVAFQVFKQEIIKASKELNSNQLIFFSEWIFDFPSKELEINGVKLHSKYNIPIGWDGYGLDDLTRLEKEGVLEKIYESEKDPLTLQKKVIYQILQI